MRIEHFERLRPVCPSCRGNRPEGPAPLILGPIVTRSPNGGDDSDDIVEGVLLCSSPSCQREHPIIDGIPIIVADIRATIAHQLANIRSRTDLSPLLSSLLGDCMGADSDFDRARYQVSSYARGHYGDLDPDEPAPRQATLAGVLDSMLALLDGPPKGVWLDVGCALGRASFELAARTGDLVLGVDLNMAMLRLASGLGRTGRIAHPIRRVGLVYDERSFAVELAASGRVAFWACDAMALPFADNAFAGALSLNVVDCVPSPVAHIMELGRVVQSGGDALVCTPYDWAESVTPLAGWIGGHSQRSGNRGRSAAEMHRLCSDEVPSSVDPRLRIRAEIAHLPWHVYVHERATMMYQVHAMAMRAL